MENNEYRFSTFADLMQLNCDQMERLFDQIKPFLIQQRAMHDLMAATSEVMGIDAPEIPEMELPITWIDDGGKRNVATWTWEGGDEFQIVTTKGDQQ